jgi:hypothetical protein
MTDVAAAAAATRVVFTYDPEAIEDISRYWVEDELSKPSFAAYVRKRYDTVRPATSSRSSARRAVASRWT